jgi:hypothetical protein
MRILRRIRPPLAPPTQEGKKILLVLEGFHDFGLDFLAEFWIVLQECLRGVTALT